MVRTFHKGFTLIELLLVVAIMGMMGTLSVSGYRAMRRGMEQRSVLRNASQFIRNAYQRAQIDRQPTAIFFWNEVHRDESDDGSQTMIVVGRAVAVRYAGRVSAVRGNVLIDEFGDLNVYRGKRYTDNGDEEYDDDAVKQGLKTNLYRMRGSGTWKSCKYPASQATAEVVSPSMCEPLLASQGSNAKGFKVYGYMVASGVGDWNVGDAYGFEFAEMTLPNNYIFGSSLNVKRIKDGPKDTGDSIWFDPSSSGGSETVFISAVRPGKNGDLEAQRLPEATERPRTN